MNACENTVVAKALRLLDSAKCKYAVIDPDGNKHGVLEVVRERKYRRLHRWNDKYQYIERLRAMKVGDTVEIEIHEGDNPSLLQSAVTGTMSHVHGAGSYVSHVIETEGGKAVQVMRVEA